MRRNVLVGKEFYLSVTVDDLPPSDGLKKSKSGHARHVVVGEPFDVSITVLGDSETLDAITRSQIVYAVLAICAIFIFGATGVGLYKSDFSGLQTVWSVIGPIYGVISAYFFTHKGGRRKRQRSPVKG